MKSVNNSFLTYIYKPFKFLLLLFKLKVYVNILYLEHIRINLDKTRMFEKTGGHFLISLKMHIFIAMSLEKKEIKKPS